MFEKQKTIAETTSVSGIGLHSGKPSTVTFRSAPINTGVIFHRVDLKSGENNLEIPADIDHVVDISRGTTIGIGKVRIATVEHLLAALAGLEIDNIYVDVEGEEIPVGDGSSKNFVDALTKAGIVEQDSPKDYITIEETILYDDVKKEGIELLALPSDDFKITYMIDYQNPAIGTQYTVMMSLSDEFVRDYAPSRTFCFLSEIRPLFEEGLIRGGSLDNAVVIVDEELSREELKRLGKLFNYDGELTVSKDGILGNNYFRYPNECCRHKTVDLIGDLYLLGHPLRGHVLAARSGHKANIELVKKIRKIYEKKQITSKYQEKKAAGVVLDVNAIRKIMPHRYPFLLVDRIIDLVPGERVVGLKNITINEPFFNGHFPDKPVMPGVLLIEAMAQVGGILMLDAEVNTEDKLIYFIGIDKAKFRKPVEPGDQVRFELDIVRRRGNVCVMSGKGFVTDDLVVQAELSAIIIEREKNR